MSAITVDIEKPKISELIKTLDSAPKLDALPHDIIGNTVYRLSLSETTKDDWKVDGFVWKNNGTFDFHKKQKVFRKTYFTCLNSDKSIENCFIKHAYISISNPHDLIVIYIDDKHNAAQRSHGNTKTLETSHTYRRTLPSTLAKIKEAVKTTPAPAVYKSSIAAAENNQPRNLNQDDRSRRRS